MIVSYSTYRALRFLEAHCRDNSDEGFKVSASEAHQLTELFRDLADEMVGRTRLPVRVDLSNVALLAFADPKVVAFPRVPRRS